MTPSRPRVLLVEDDVATASSLRANLEANGFATSVAGTAAEAQRHWDAARPDLLILDLGLPDRDGLTVIRRIRREAATPILVLSARHEEHDKVAALDLGADDYVTKPIGVEELRARVAALLRRSGGPVASPDGRIRLGAIEMDPNRRAVTVDGAAVELTPREFELLRVLLTSPGRVVTAGRLLRAVWGQAYTTEGHYLHVYVSRLRRKLDAAAGGRRIDLVVAEPGVGYRVREA